MSHKTPKFRRSELARSVLIACSTTAAVLAMQPVLAQEAGQQLQRVEIVGSNIARVNAEGPSPVVILKKEDIAKSGATNVNELLKTMGVILGGFDDQNNNSSAPGAAAASIRGVGADSTLVLLNGRRMAPHGLSQATGTGDVTFVDLNTLPLGAIEQIQILKDGASAIYGSDAIAGVINVITKKNYQGFEGRATVGNTSDGGGAERGATVTGGWGDIDVDGWNVLATVDLLHKDPISYKQRELTKTADLRQFGGRDLRSAGSPFMSFTTDGGDTFFSPSCPATNLRGGICRWEPSDQEGLQGTSDRSTFYSVFNKKLSNDLNFFGEAMYTKNVTLYTARSAFLDFGAAGSDAVQQAASYRGLDAAQTDALKLQVRNLLTSQFKATYPGVVDSATPEVLPFGRATETGPRQQDNTSTTRRFVAGLSGVSGAFDWQAAFSRASNTTVLQDGQEINADLFITGILANKINVVKLPKSGFEFAQFNGWRAAEYTVTSADAKMSGEIMKLPAGGMSLALGVDWRLEELKDSSDAATTANLSLGSGAQDATGSRTAYSVYGELSIPLIKDLEAQVALRRDHFSDFGDTTNPKVALRYQPIQSLVLRTSYATSFRAPSLFQLFKSVKSDDFQELIDKPRCAVTGAAQDCDAILRPTRADGAANAGGLLPEKGKSTNFGLVWAPTRDSNIGFDVWHIEKTDAIQTADAQDILNRNVTANILRFPSQTPGVPGVISRIITGYGNIGVLDVKGVDLDGSVTFNLSSAGRLTLGGSISFLQNYTKDGVDYAGTWTGGAAYPKRRAQTKISWTDGAYSATMIGNHLDSYKDDPDSGFDRTLEAFSTYDLQFGYSGFKNTDLRIGARNAFNKAPPLSFSSYVPFDQANTSAKGRFIYANIGYKF